MRDRSVDVMLLCAIWYDVDSVSIRRLRADGFGVNERARPDSSHAEASLGVNHNRVAIMAAAGVHPKAVDIGTQPSTFECLAAHILSDISTCLVVVIHDTGPVTANFFVKISDILDHLSTFGDPLSLSGDVNIYFERALDTTTIEFINVLEC